KQIGGVGVIALHLSNFVKEVHCYTNGLSRETLPENVGVTNLASGQLIETRFVDRDTGHPVFKSKSFALTDIRADSIPDFDNYDLVLIADFGHGLLDPKTLNRAVAARRRAVVGAMAQVNSS